MTTPTAIVPVSHAAVINRETIDEFVVKYRAHMFRIRKRTEHDVEYMTDTIYTVDHRFESMSSWTWVGDHRSDISAFASVASYTGSDFGYVSDSQMHTFNAITPPFNEPDTSNSPGFLWFDPGEYVAVYVDSPSLLPLEFWSTENGGSCWYLGVSNTLEKPGMRTPIGKRNSGKDEVDIVDVVDSETTQPSTRLCELSDILCVSPPSSKEIERVWDSVRQYDRDNMFQ